MAVAHTFERAARNLANVLEQAAKFDSWGQIIEASEAYQRLCRECAETSTAGMDEEDKQSLHLIVNHARRRGEILQMPATSGRTEDVNHQQIGADIEILNEIIFKMKRKKSLRRKSSVAVMKAITEGGLLPPLRPKVSGSTYLTIRVEKIGLKDAMTFVDPFITVLLKDDKGRDLTPSQSTPPANLYKDKYIIFNEDVHIQKTADEIQDGHAVVFEFKHYKAGKNKISIKCFALLEKDEIKDGALALELYQKPVDYTRKKLCLLTEKKLYLHIILILQNWTGR